LGIVRLAATGHKLAVMVVGRVMTIRRHAHRRRPWGEGSFWFGRWRL